MHIIRRIPIHPFLIAIYPILQLLSHNISQVELWVAYRSLLIAGSSALILFGILFLILRNNAKAGLITSVFMLVFFTYGPIYNSFKKIGAPGTFFLAHHTVLVPILVILLVGICWLIWHGKNLESLTEVFNLGSALLVVLAIIPIAYYKISLKDKEQQQPVALNSQLSPVKPLSDMPDIYYIILDSYTRADALQSDFGTDTTPFLNQMKDLGFYVADCARSNYSFTEVSMASAFNMNYLPELNPAIQPSNPDLTLATAMIQNNFVRRQLESMGYKTVAFETGYAWNHWTDADLYLSPTENPLMNASVQPFEAMLIQTTGLLPLYDTHSEWFNGTAASRHHEEFINRTLFTMDWLEKLPSLNAPKFVYAHINVPHVPFVWKADGTIQNNQNYFKGEQDYPVSDKYYLDGYSQAVQFLDNRAPGIVKQIIKNSKNPPIIIIQGDHGMRSDNRLEILDLYLIPGGSKELYPSITPVNSFRVIFNTFFKGNYPLLDGHSYLSTYNKPYDVEEVPEQTERCKSK
jgi:hypothetical protein